MTSQHKETGLGRETEPSKSGFLAGDHLQSNPWGNCGQKPHDQSIGSLREDGRPYTHLPKYLVLVLRKGHL